MPGRWQAWVLKQNVVWVDIKGSVIPVSSIEGRYALNILKFIYRLHRSSFHWTDPLVTALTTLVKNDMRLYYVEIVALISAEPNMQVRYLDDEDWSHYDDFDDEWGGD